MDAQGAGVQERTISCEQVLADDHLGALIRHHAAAIARGHVGAEGVARYGDAGGLDNQTTAVYALISLEKIVGNG